jgi:DNA-binding NtrC family response regulator
MIAKHFLDSFSRDNQMPKVRISAEAQERLLQHPFPGNVRELKSVVELAAVMCSDGEIQAKDLTFTNVSTEQSFMLKEMSLQEYTYRIIRSYLSKYDNNVLEVARKLDIGKSSIYRYLKDMENAGI